MFLFFVVPRTPEPAFPAIPSPELTRQMLAEKQQKLRQALPLPEKVLARIRGLARPKAEKEAP